MTAEQKRFIEKIGTIVAAEMRRSRILVSLVIAQAILESNWGKSGLTVIANALFGIKANSSWKGRVYSAQTKECYDGINFVTVTGLFRAYDSWGASIADHTALLSGASRYKAVIGEKDFRAACKAVHAAGYATDPGYAGKLINLIERYALAEYDILPDAQSEPEAALVPGTVTLCMDNEIYQPVAENVGGHWYIKIAELGGLKVRLREVLYAAGYKNLVWERYTNTVIARKE